MCNFRFSEQFCWTLKFPFYNSIFLLFQLKIAINKWLLPVTPLHSIIISVHKHVIKSAIYLSANRNNKLNLHCDSNYCRPITVCRMATWNKYRVNCDRTLFTLFCFGQCMANVHTHLSRIFYFVYCASHFSRCFIHAATKD